MRRLTTLLLLAGAVALGACGGDDESPATAAGAPAAGFPVTIESRLGAATIDERPQRVVALDGQSADALLALGVTPVAMARTTYVEGDVQQWTKAALRGRTPELLDVDENVPYERLAALRPDLVVASHAYLVDRGAFARLSRIAPTIAPAGADSVSDTWQTTLTRVGQAIGRQDRARELVDEVEGLVADARRRTPAFEGATVNIFNAAPQGLYAINERRDYSMQLMADLGMRLSPEVEALDGESGRAVISRERFDLLDCDVLVGTSISSSDLRALSRDTLFKRVPAVRDGRYVALDIGPATSLAFPTVLSVRWAAERVLPRLAAAVQEQA